MKVLFISAKGLSTSLMVENTSKSANKRNIECTIHQVSSLGEVDKSVDYEVCLLAPQKRSDYSQVKSVFNNVGVIDMRAYAHGDGEVVLDQVLSLMEN